MYIQVCIDRDRLRADAVTSWADFVGLLYSPAKETNCIA